MPQIWIRSLYSIDLRGIHSMKSRFHTFHFGVKCHSFSFWILYLCPKKKYLYFCIHWMPFSTSNWTEHKKNYSTEMVSTEMVLPLKVLDSWQSSSITLISKQRDGATDSHLVCITLKGQIPDSTVTTSLDEFFHALIHHGNAFAFNVWITFYSFITMKIKTINTPL